VEISVVGFNEELLIRDAYPLCATLVLELTNRDHYLSWSVCISHFPLSPASLKPLIEYNLLNSDNLLHYRTISCAPAKLYISHIDF
jgi:hypothetical protein